MIEQVATKEQLEYLDMLRESGVTNMYGAGAYLKEEFGLDKYVARKVLSEWMASFPRQEVKDE